ncbi:YbaY family lipoprotein [Enterobacillus tribolii]|uniref:Putative lipoprotein n=1 Tax=Enterobacillus tribolii TaxID=1487935 RepID=A0A370QNL5_9GAMM|nr:YbaY family lipoprotein [Enterobacillus tribolii]MBW7982057.1 hypothetical protein [Enterobacillus tribolii]RDK89922.1 putative lipoprotein [Enterobacillus tribolii]
MKLWKIAGCTMIVAAVAGCSSNPRGVEMFGDLPTSPAVGANAPVNGPAIKGSVNIRQRMALPPTAVVTVTLSDISLADAPAKIVAQKAFRTEGSQAPFYFTLPYEQELIQPQHRIILSAAISVDGKLLFVTDTVNEVINNNAGTQKDLLLVPASPEAATPMRDEAASGITLAP